MSTLNELIEQIDNPDLRKRIADEVTKLNKQKKFGLVFEEHLPECTPLYDIPVKKGALVMVKGGNIKELYCVRAIADSNAECVKKDGGETVTMPVDSLVSVAQFGEPIYPYLKPLDSVCNAPDSDLWHTLIEADNYHALQLLEYLYAGKVDCIYIDPPYNTGARDWKYNNDYVDGNDSYRHSKWLSMMQKRLQIAKKLLNPKDSVLIVTIDEKEYLHLGCLLEEMFPEARMQMISSLINITGVSNDRFGRTDEYLFIIYMGQSSPAKLPLDEDWIESFGKTTRNELHWRQLLRSGSNSTPDHSPGCYYPIFVSDDGKHITGVGKAINQKLNSADVVAPVGSKAILPVHTDGSKGVWQVSPNIFSNLVEKGYIKLGNFTQRGMAINYLAKGEQTKVESGEFKIIGHAEDGSIIVDDSNYIAKFIPGSQWRIRTHDATRHGTGLINNILGNKVFSYPKSLYAVHDAIRFFVANKPNALIVDFFAGSGTTLHAVNLLNTEDGGHRRCILVTNNEVSEVENKELTTKGFKPGDEEWEKLGIARYVTWPRTVCSIEGHDVNGNPLKGNYIGSDIPMADGFKANANFFKLGFLDKTRVSLGMQFAEMLPTLWMKAGAIGECPSLDEKSVPEMLILPKNKMAILNNENQFAVFAEELTKYPEIETVYLVTDYEASFISMTNDLPGRTTYQLYRDYLDNFRINAGRNAR